MVSDFDAHLDKWYEESKLPHRPNYKAANELYLSIITELFFRTGKAG